MSNEPGILPEPISFGKYYLLELISVGGMAEIYKAKAFGVEGFERLLAVKKILSSIAEDESFIEMFVDEAKIAGQLSHPNIAQIFDLGKVDDSYYIALEYISGKDLKTIFERARRIGSEVDIPRICYAIMKVCEGLEYAHNKKDSQGEPLNIVHRDISPQNILLSYEGEVKIIDFGIAKAQGKTSQTQVGVLKGKFSYMSPEQVRGLHVDHRSDIFSLGIVLYEMLTLERLFLGESDFDTLEKIRKVEMSPPSLYNPNIPDELEEIVLKALAQDPDDRFQSAGAFGEALERFMRNQDYYYKNTDLADFMKDAFEEDLEFEQKKLEYFRELDLDPPDQQRDEEEDQDEGLEWDDDEMETQIFDRDNRDPGGITPSPSSEPASPPGPEPSEPDIVYADEESPNTPQSDSQRIEVVGPDQEVDVVERGDNPPPTQDYDRSDLAESGLPEAAPDQPQDDMGGGTSPDSQPSRRRRTTQMGGDRAVQDEPQAQAPPPSSSSSDSFLGRPVVWIVAAGVMLVGVAGLGVWRGWFSQMISNEAEIQFQAQSETTPKKVRIFINGEQIHDGALPYTHTFRPTRDQTDIKVSKEGYQSDVGTQKLKPGFEYQFGVDLEKIESAGEIMVRSEPSGAEVTLDGNSLDGTTPVTAKELDKGAHTLVLTKKGYLETTKEISLQQGESTEVTVPLRPKTVALTVESDPSGASFEIRDRSSDETVERGETPETLETLDASTTYQIVIDSPGYKTWKETFEPGTEAKPTVEATLDKEETEPSPDPVARRETDRETDSASPGTAREPSSTGATDSNTTGGSAPSSEEIQPPSSSQEEESPQEEESSPAAKASTSEESESPSESQPGTININSIPAAKVYIDGKSMGYTPIVNHTISAGSHTIRLSNEGVGLNKTYHVDIEPGGSKKIINKK